jgi:hypothetical protein
LDTVWWWFGFLALASDYPELIEKIIVDALPCLPALMNPTFKQ